MALGWGALEFPLTWRNPSCHNKIHPAKASAHAVPSLFFDHNVDVKKLYFRTRAKNDPSMIIVSLSQANINTHVFYFFLVNNYELLCNPKISSRLAPLLDFEIARARASVASGAANSRLLRVDWTFPSRASNEFHAEPNCTGNTAEMNCNDDNATGATC